MKSLLLILWVMLGGVGLRFQPDLPPDQAALLESLAESFDARDAWKSYHESAEYEISYAVTLTGQTTVWETGGRFTNLEADIDGASRIEGQARDQIMQSNSTADPIMTETQFLFSVSRNRVSAAPTDSDELITATPQQLESLAPLLQAKDTWGFTIPADLLGHVTAIYDLGALEDSDGRLIQQYEVTLDLADSLPWLNFDPDPVAARFNGWVPAERLAPLLLESGQLTLLASVDFRRGELISLETRLQSFVELETASGLLILEYGETYQAAYSEITD